MWSNCLFQAFFVPETETSELNADGLCKRLQRFSALLAYGVEDILSARCCCHLAPSALLLLTSAPRRLNIYSSLHFHPLHQQLVRPFQASVNLCQQNLCSSFGMMAGNTSCGSIKVAAYHTLSTWHVSFALLVSFESQLRNNKRDLL